MHQNALLFRISICINLMVKSRKEFTVDPPLGLFDKIMSRIHGEQRLLAIKYRIIVFSISLVGSLIAFFPALQTVKTEFIESGFIQFFSLFFSDFSIVMTYWQSFVLTLLEALPAFGLVMLLTVVFIFLGSLRFLTKDIKSVFATI